MRKVERHERTVANINTGSFKPFIAEHSSQPVTGATLAVFIRESEPNL
jgi:hypothetical protein